MGNQELITVVLILGGGVIMLFSIIGTQKILSIKTNGKYRSNWYVLIGLMVAFIGGYLLTAYLIVVGQSDWLGLIIGVVFFLGALFVLIVVHSGWLTMNQLSKNYFKQKESSRKLQVKNKELEQFAYITSHDLQEPLKNLEGLIQLVLLENKGQLDEETVKYFDLMNTSTLRMQSLIKNLLSFSKLDGKPRMEEVDLNAIVAELMEDLQLLIQSKNAEIICETMPAIKGNPQQIKQLFQNLISNAIKFKKPNEGVVVRISTQLKKGVCKIKVSDNGIGIEPESLQSIFKIFSRAHEGLGFEGTGIGLAHCKKIIESHGGKIWVQSTPGVGSDFKFHLPAI